ncbi:hypothetical protein HSACCH_00857 [Halanaerobium saccharolyticum subsp. saccharolyticum DSM 6643]|uniref:Uncharacterized protein n=1 Tax=Halanaerobium saccharolyticum subsp. saccharolyticum DSM 6643 TaxID=1293054 RepID=M5DYQ0_9FIRM|nr:hypothetical protein [Halanaerobium saccharolyticum]CCU78718.1 hypothetical protein HSACCH_00857 [Halanaerobium saccharolyticum subsp. saccharolyticum DSM 6643]
MFAPKRNRYNKKQRLAAAEKWITEYEGKNLVKGYSKWFGVDKICAINELELLGHDIDSEYKEQIYKHEIEKEDAKKANNISRNYDKDDFDVSF